MYDRLDGTVKQYPYRTAIVKEVFMTVPRDSVELLEQQLAELAGVRVDNHTAYELVQDEGTTYISFSDFTARFGRSVEEKRW